MSHEDFDRLILKYLNETTRKNIKEILDSIRKKGPGDAPTESARHARKAIRNIKQASHSAGSIIGASDSSLDGIQPVQQQQRSRGTRNTFNSESEGHFVSQNHNGGGGGMIPVRPPRNTELAETVKEINEQLRNADFRERIEAIEKFQILCETSTEAAINNLVQVEFIH
jgi:hypothetical protein